MKLETTNDYSKFVTNKEQRKINPLHAKKIAQNMADCGFIPSKPIQCYKDGNKLVVVDGHHRLEAAKTAGIYLYYVVEPKQCQESMAVENSLVKPWGQIDFVRLYANRGIKDYMELLAYQDRGIPLNMAASMLIDNDAGSGNAHKSIKSGNFKIKTRYLINLVLSFIDEFGSTNHAINNRSFIAAISSCILCNEIDIEILRSRIRENTSMIEKTSTTDVMLEQLERVYNFRSRNPIPLKFIVKKSSQSRSVSCLKK